MTIIRKTVAIQWESRKAVYDLCIDTSFDHEKTLIESLDQNKVPDAEVALLLLHALREGDVAIDVGANIGFFTLLMSRLVGKKGHILAYEPGPETVKVLDHNIQINQATNCSLVDRPVWSVEKDVQFFINADNRSSHSMYDPGRWYGNIKTRADPKTIPTHTTTLNDAPCDQKHLRLIKIDVEGAEWEVLQGATRLLEECHPPFIVVEFNPFAMSQAGWTSEQMRGFMGTYGYRMFFLNTDGFMPALVPDKTAVVHRCGTNLLNILFSTEDAVAQAWPEAYG